MQYLIGCISELITKLRMILHLGIVNNKHDRSTGQVSLSDRMRTESVTHKTVLVENDGGDDYDEVRKILDLCQNCWISVCWV